MDRVVPWVEIAAVIEPHYPKAGAEGGRPAIALEKMLRIFLQAWFNLSDPAVEEALYESASMRSFVGIDLGVEPAPDETTVCKFRYRLEKHGLGQQIFAVVNTYLKEASVAWKRAARVGLSGPERGHSSSRAAREGLHLSTLSLRRPYR